MACSAVSQGTATRFLESLGVRVVNGTVPTIAGGSFQSFVPFAWNSRKEDDAMGDLYEHIFTELEKFNAPLSKADAPDGKFKLVDVHKHRRLLDVSDDKLAKISGGTDFLVVPQGVADESYASTACVILEAKSEQRLFTEGLGKNLPQLIVEMIAARYHSAQPNVMAVLSDFATKTCVMVYDYNPETEVISIVKYADVSLNVLGKLIASHLSNRDCSVPNATYAPTVRGEPKAEERFVLACKRKWHTDLLTTVAWEHFEEMMPDTRPFSSERRELVGQLFTSWGCERIGGSVDNSSSMYV